MERKSNSSSFSWLGPPSCQAPAGGISAIDIAQGGQGPRREGTRSPARLPPAASQDPVPRVEGAREGSRPAPLPLARCRSGLASVQSSAESFVTHVVRHLGVYTDQTQLWVPRCSGLGPLCPPWSGADARLGSRARPCLAMGMFHSPQRVHSCPGLGRSGPGSLQSSVYCLFPRCGCIGFL